MTIRLQSTGQISGQVFDVDGVTVAEGVQVRVSSRQKGVISQVITSSDGSFAFDTLPQSDGPFMLDAFVDGRLRARISSLVFMNGEDEVIQNIQLSAVGLVKGHVRDIGGLTYSGAEVMIQSLGVENFTYTVLTDPSGEFVLPAIPVGEFELTATTQEGDIGRAYGEVIEDDEVINMDVILASNTLVGTVFERDGVTAVGAGVTVYLAPKDSGQFYSYENHPDAIQTLTDGSGQYGFSITQPGDFYVQAELDLDRGRSGAVVVNLDPVNPFVSDITLLAKGRVYGVIVDANGVVQENVEVEIYSEGAFEARRTVLTDQNGYYNLDGVFAGNLVLSAVNPVNDESAVRYERLDAEGEQVEINVTLSASGTLQGRIIDFDDSVIQSPVRLQVKVDDIPFTEIELLNGSAFSIERVPIGDVTLVAEEIQTGNKGIVVTRLDYQNHTRLIDVKLVGQGSIEVTLENEIGDPAAGATVKISTRNPFRVEQSLTSDVNGMVRFDAVFAGDYQVTATRNDAFGALSGAAAGTLLPNENQQLLIQMEAVPVGLINGILYESDGITPAGAGWVVRMTPEPFEDAYVTTTDVNGFYEFPQVNAGSYDIVAMNFYGLDDQCPTQDRNRAGAFDVLLSVQDEEVVADLLLIGSGEVYGVVTDENDQPVANADITLTNADPFFGANVTCLRRTTYETKTNGNGEYRLFDIPPGNFTILAEDATETQRAEGAGRVGFDGDEVEINLSLINNVVTMPYDFYDANGFHYDISGTGSIQNGTRNVYGANAPDTEAMLLEIITNGVPVPFANGDGTLGELSSDGQEVSVDDVTPSGLFVTRKIRVPRAGYFSRYLEVLHNPTEDPIEVGVRIKSHHRADDSNPRIVDSSDGDQVLSVVHPSNPDRWVVVDDQSDADPFANSSIAASGHVFDGMGGDESVDDAIYELIAQDGRLTYQWDNITVEPGETKILMHIAFGQIKRDTARVAAERILSVPPEILEGMTSDDKAAVVNFDLPEHSSVEPLPNLEAGRVTGVVLSGNGVTQIPNADVQFKSLHPLFTRVRYTESDESGAFVFESTLDGTEDNYVIPVYGFNLSAEYRETGAASAITPSDFEAGMTETQQDLIFIGKGDVRGTVYRHYGSSVADVVVKLCNTPTAEACLNTHYPDNKTVSEADGTYLLPVNEPRDYFLAAILTHPQQGQSGRGLHGTSQVTVSPADVIVADVVMEETGSIEGTVTDADGVPISNVELELLININNSYRIIRGTSTDTSGFYRFYDVPVGDFRINAVDPISNATGEAITVLQVDDVVTEDITLQESVLLNVHVTYERGVSASDSRVTFYDGITSRMERTDSNGLAQFLARTGSYQISAVHPDVDYGSPPSLTTTITVEISENESQVDVDVTLQPAGDVFGTIVRPDGTTLAGGFPYNISQIRGASFNRVNDNTSNVGGYRFNGLPLGDYIITAYDAEQDRFADAIFTIATDGQEVMLDLTLLDERIALPADLVDANRFVYDVQQDGSLTQGSNAFSDAAAELSINGTLFTGDTSARLQAGRRQFAITQPTPIEGLNVTRKIYVPRGAYFSRYIEVFENPTTQDITVDIGLSHTYSVGEVVNTSSQDVALSETDEWFVIDDDIDDDIMLYPSQMPATAHVFNDAAGTLIPTAVSVFYDNLKPTVTQSWNQVTIPAGETRSLMHVTVQQINRLGVETAVNRLSQLSPELLADMTLLDIESIINFDVPDNALSSLENLPSLTGSINGVVYEGNETTEVPLTRVTIQSHHPLFSRVWGMKSNDYCPGGTILSSLYSSNEDALYLIEGQLTDTDSIAIPTGIDVTVSAQISQSCYEDYAGHPFTNVHSRVVEVEASSEQNVIFDTGVFTGSVVGSVDYSITSAKVYLSIDNIGPPDYQYTNSNPDGSYVYPGVLPGRYDLLFETNHSDSRDPDILRGGKKAIDIQAGQVLVSDVNLQPTGSVQGSVSAYDGAPSENAEVTLYSVADDQQYDQCDSGCVAESLAMHQGKREVSRRVYTDSLGRYNFNTVPEGVYEFNAIDPVSGAVTTHTVSVTANQITTQNVVLTAMGSATVTVLNVSDSPVIDAVIYVDTVAPGGEVVAGRTDFNGQFTVANIPLGQYDLRITDPRSPSITYFDTTLSDQITASGQNNNHQVNLKSQADVLLTVIDTDDGGAPVEGADVSISDARGSRNLGLTDVNGQLMALDVPSGSFEFSVEATVDGIEKQETVTGTVLESDDDSTIPFQVDLKSTIVTLPVNISDANNNDYRISNTSTQNYVPSLWVDGDLFQADSTIAQQDGRQLYSRDSGMTYGGLTVSRKAYVPLNGYFLRYQEILENQNNFDITLDVSVATRIDDGDIVMTSSGDAAIQNSGADKDLWYVSQSSTNEFFAFLGSDETEGSFIYELQHKYVNSWTDEAELTWYDVTIPANSQVQFLHFFVRQTTQDSAVASMNRLLEMPPELLTGLSLNDVNEIQNFDLPSDLQSFADPLPELTGEITGHVYEGDDVTPVESVDVSITSDHLLYPNTYDSFDVDTLETDENGAFSVIGALINDGHSIAIPIGSEFTVSTSRGGSVVEENVTIAEGINVVDVDLIFNTGFVSGSFIGAHEYENDSHISVVVYQNGQFIRNGSVNQNDLTYLIDGLEAGTYDLRSSMNRLYGYANGVTVNTGLVTTVDIMFDPNGAVSGEVTSSTGMQLPNQEVIVTQDGTDFERSTYTDSTGQYHLAAIPVGEYTVTAINSDTNSVSSSAITIIDQQTTTQDLAFVGLGTVTIDLLYQSGVVVPNTNIYYSSDSVPQMTYLGRTDANGQLIAEIPVGNYTLRASRPGSGQNAFVQGVVNFEGEASAIDLYLPASAHIQFNVVDGASGNAPINNARVSIDDINDSLPYGQSRYSDANGTVLFENLHQTTYEVTVEFDDHNETSLLMTITVAMDEQTIVKDLTVNESHHQINTYSYSDERLLQQIEATAGEILSINSRVIDDYSCSVDISVFDPNGQLMASGYVSRSDIYSSHEDLRLIPLDIHGRYTIETTPRNNNCASESQFISGSIDGESIVIEAYSIGGSVSGHVYESDGSTPVVGEWVRVQSLAPGPAIDRRAITDASGEYMLTGVPLGDVNATYVTMPSVVGTANLVNAGDNAVIDLTLPSISSFNVRVLNADGTAIDRQARLRIEIPGQSVFQPYTNSMGEYTYDYSDEEVVTFSVTSPYNSQIRAFQRKPATGGQISVDLILDMTELSGIVYEADGVTPVADSYVRVTYEYNGLYVANAYTDAQGQYQFNSLPINIGLNVSAEDPINRVQVFETVTLEQNINAQQDLVLSGHGSVSGQIVGIGDIPAAGFRVKANFVYNPDTGQTTSLSTTTDDNGYYTIDRLPFGQEVSVSYDHYLSYSYLYDSQTITITNAGDTEVVDFQLPGSSLIVQLTAADGLSIGEDCHLNMETESNGGGEKLNGEGSSSWVSDNQNCDASFYVIAIPGNQDIEIKIKDENYENIYQHSLSLASDSLIELTPVLSVITGQVTYHDGSSVPDASIVSDTGYGTVSDPLGAYRLLGVKQGTVNLEATDYSTGLSGEGQLTLSNESIPEVLDIQLQPSGSISGMVYDASGQPVSDARVYVQNKLLEFEVSAYTESDGSYDFSHVALGNIALSVSDYDSKNVTSADTTLVSDGDSVVVDLHFLNQGSVSGTLTDDQGQPIDSGCVELRHSHVYEAFDDPYHSTQTDVSGNYNFDSVAPGTVLISGLSGSCYNQGPVALIEEEIIENTTGAVDLETGNATRLSAALNDGGTGYRLNVWSNGGVAPENNNGGSLGENTTFNRRLELKVNGFELNEQRAAFDVSDNQQLIVGPSETNQLRFEREIYSGINGDFARLADKVTNIGSTTQNIVVTLSGAYGPYAFDDSEFDPTTDIILQTDPSNNGHQYAIHQFNGSDPLDPAVVGYVFTGQVNPLPPSTGFASGESEFMWSWTYTLDPGETAVFVSFLVYSEPGNLSSVQSVIDELSDGSKADMFDGMSASDLQDVVNFDTP